MGHFDTGEREPKRDRWGRYLLPHPETGVEQPWTRVTTVSGILSDRYNLELWAQRMVALGLAERPDLIALVKGAARKGPNDYSAKRSLNKVVKDALEAGNKEQRANLGTAIHAATEALDLGEEWDLQPPYDADVRAYGNTMRRLKLKIVPGWVERIVIVPELGVAGTLDRMVKRPQWKLPRIADIKTGKTVHFSELDHAIQQAMYANASHYWDYEDMELKPMPKVDKANALIIHVPAGEAKCEVHNLDIKSGWEAAKVAVEVREWRARKDLSEKFE